MAEYAQFRNDVEHYDERLDELFAHILAFEQKHPGVSPSIRELTDLMGYRSTSATNYALCELEARGLIRRGEHAAARWIEIVGARLVYDGTPSSVGPQRRSAPAKG